ncbi:hypothetical protein BsWGS_00827 [Bradybaena similaris]
MAVGSSSYQILFIIYFRVEGEITFLVQGLLHQHSNLLSLARNHIVISFLERFRTVHDLRSTGEDSINMCSHLDSTARLCITTCFQFAVKYAVNHPKSSHGLSCLTAI